ncbi:hypothetical protein PVAND_007993 [Polypedilum vanderplanki]|uniref:SOWAHA-C winged helix-turn-helix domain-containing protein n=1 Tax=Polypedilum vanderplanki TaxID=319348 RepID=A0A9J6C951_POLVA|nr:hypothetical protein PVAND_007993 [Polypedilum vanderplanki]
MDEPSELSLREIHKYFVRNNYKVTNTQLVKYFRKFLTGNRVEDARKQFKTFVNILATIKNENNEKYLILRKKYYDEVPFDDTNMSLVSSSSMMSLPSSEYSESPVKNVQQLPPPAYRLPPRIGSQHASSSSSTSSLPTSPMHQFPSLPLQHQPLQQQHAPIPISMTTVGLPILEPQTRETYKECVNEFQQVMSDFMGTSNKVDVASRKNSFEQIIEEQAPSLPPRKKIDHRSLSRECSVENQPTSPSFEKDENKENVQSSIAPDNEENKSVSVREAMLKFNKFAAEEEAKVPSPISKLVKNKSEKIDETGSSESLTSHPKAKEWMISAARANYQELAKLGHEFPCLVRLQDPNTTALHWASKHGNLNCVKLIAGTFKCDPNIQTNGGYTSLHIAMQFGRNDVFEILCNVYKADRDILDWSGKKPLDYQKQLTSISALTFNKISKSRKKFSEKDQSNSFLRIGSLRIGNLLGNAKQSHHHHNNLIQRISMPQQPSTLTHKNTHFGSVDNLPEIMGPPKNNSVKKRKQKRDDYSFQTQSMPTTPNLENRHKSTDLDGSDSDTAYGFHDNWGA